MHPVAKALEDIPFRRDQLNVVDSRLSVVIRHVEHVLSELKPGIPAEVKYATPDGNRWIQFQKMHNTWTIVSSEDEDEYTPIALLSAPRHVRAEVFVRGDDNLAPIERLIIAVANSLVVIKGERSPSLDVAASLMAVLQEAGFPET